MLSLNKLKAIDLQPVLFNIDEMPILDAVNDDEEMISEASVVDPEFERLNKYWQNFYKERGETHYEKLMKQWQENQLFNPK